MIRRLFTIASVFSLLLCVAVAGLWISSYWTAPGAEVLGNNDREFHVKIASGCAHILVYTPWDVVGSDNHVLSLVTLITQLN